jgi:hypothetical protein
MPTEPLERDPVVTVEDEPPPSAPAVKPARVGTAALLDEIRSLPEKVAAAVGGNGKPSTSGTAEVTFVGEPPPEPQAPPPTAQDPSPPPAINPVVNERHGYRFPAGRRRASLPS